MAPVAASLSSNALFRAFHGNRMLACIAALHYLSALVASRTFGQDFENALADSFLTLFEVMVPIFLVAFVFWRFAVGVFSVRPSRPIRWFADDLRRTVIDPDRLLGGLVALFSVMLVIRGFSFFKNLVPLEGPRGIRSSQASTGRSTEGMTPMPSSRRS